MLRKLPYIAVLFSAFILAAGMAPAQPSIQVTSVNNDGTTSTTTLTRDDASGPSARTPAVGRYWDGLSSTDYYNRPPFIAAPPNPQIAVGPDDILTIVNRTVARYPNPNAGGAGQGITVQNPYNNPPTEQVWLDLWMGVTVLGPQAGGAALCASGTGSNGSCIIDNASIRYDQLQGRFVVLFTVTDLPAHRSNFVVVVSRYSQFTKCSSTTPLPVTCPASSPLFTPPVIAPIVGGTQTGGQNPANWVLYSFPINLTYRSLGDGSSTETALGTGLVSTPSAVTTGGASASFLTTPFCPGGGPPVAPTGVAAPRTCTNYFPTGARMGFDNDNLILTAPVLDMSFSPSEGGTLIGFGRSMGPYAGTRVVAVPKLMLYNGTAFTVLDQPPVCGTVCQAVNLADDVATGTLTTLLGACGAIAAPAPGVCAATNGDGLLLQPIPAIFWEPDNLRGRALASFDAQVAPFNNFTAGVITPFDYLVGTKISDNFGALFVPGAGTQYFVQPIIFSCPGVAIFPGPAGLSFCGGTSGSQVADLPVLGPLRSAFSQLSVSDPAPVGQGYAALQQTTNPSNVPVSGSITTRLFVGDSRPQQVMFREGLLYVARTVRSYDSGLVTGLNGSTVLYELLKTCASGGGTLTNGNSLPSCGGFSAAGANVTSPFSALSGIWLYSVNVPFPAGNIPAFGFYQPMFESPADVFTSGVGGPTPPINEFPWLENVFVGMTTGGPSNVASTFSNHFPSLWDFRPGDDVFDTQEPYIDPYTGVLQSSVPCSGDVTVMANVVKNSPNIGVFNTAGLQVGMYLLDPNVSTFPAVIKSITPGDQTGASIVLSSNYTGPSTGSGFPPVQPVQLTFSVNPPGANVTITQIVNGSNQITVDTTAGLQIGQIIANVASVDKFGVISAVALNTVGLFASGGSATSGVGVGETVRGATTSIVATTLAGSTIMTVNSSARVAPNESISGTSIQAGTKIVSVVQDADPTLLDVTLSAAALTGGTTVLTVDSTPFFAANTEFRNPITISGLLTVNPPALFDTGTVPPPNGNGIPVRFVANYGGGLNSFLPANTMITNIVGNVVTLSSPATVGGTGVGSDGVQQNGQFQNITAFPVCTVPTVGGGNTSAPCSGNLPLSVITGNNITVCPMIPFSTRGGASTDPNDGSLWLYGAFAKNRLSSIPGPGAWGTAVANYPLAFPASDTYNNDNFYFQDVQPGNPFFTWIQIAKNQGLAQPSTTGPCVINNGGFPVQQPPGPGTTPGPGPSQLICPYFGPDTVVTRAEMAYWVVRSQMDEPLVSNYLCATGGDPTGTTICTGTSGGVTASTFSDVSNINNPFIAVPTLGFTGISNAQLQRYIEVMYRRGYTKGCGNTNDPQRRYCPNDPVKRQEMAVFLVRAKMNNVFPTTLSGIQLSAPYGDNFGLFQQSTNYFTDVTTSATDPAKDYYIYVQKMRELRITNGTSGSTFSPAQSLTRKEIVTFVVRAFFL